MSEINAHPQNQKKTRLGRGLGSLLGSASMDSTSSTAQTVETPLAAVPVSAVPAPVAAFQAPVITTPPVKVEESKIAEESQIWQISVERLRPNTQQPRQVFLPEALRDLTASIKEKGILQPIVARRLDERSFEIIAGERRWRAAQAAGLHEVPVILKKVSEQDSLELAIIENIQRENLNPLEEAEAYDRLMSEYNLTQQLVADKVGKERATVANALRLLMLPREVKEMLKRSEISSGHAKAILSVDNPLDQIAIAKRAVADRLSVRATEKLVARTKVLALAKDPPSQNAKPEVSKRLIESLSSELQKLLGTKVAIDYVDGKGKLSISYYSDDELNQLVEKIRAACSK